VERPNNEDVRTAWDANAAFWDENMEAGRTWQRTLVAPAVGRLLDLEPAERVLEIACGNGEYARRMAELGVHVVATDFSEPMLERARARGGDIEYRRMDATDPESLAAIAAAGPFDAVVCNMALMDMQTLDPLAEAVPSLLAPAGRFVLSVIHPAFCGGDSVRAIEQIEHDDHVERRYSVKVSHYITPRAARGIAVEGQPEPQWYFDRPISLLLAPFFRAGLVVDGIEEAVMPPGAVREGSMDALFREIPGIFVARLRATA
jgi:SAM-dependent methyltransferase